MKNIASALVKAQKEFAPALKTSTNPHFKSKYVGLDGCVEAVLDALNNNGIYLMQRNHDCEDGVKIETVLLHESGEEFSGGILHVPSSKHDAQGYGSALTYARRYSLMATCGIAPEDDDGNAASKPVVKVVTPKPLTDHEFELLIETMAACSDLVSLQGVFGGAWKRANDKEKNVLQNEYNIRKHNLEKAA